MGLARNIALMITSNIYMPDVPGTSNDACMMVTFVFDEHSNADGGIFIRKAYF